MERAALIGLIDTCVQEFDSDGLADLLPEFKEHLPGLLQSSNDEDFAILVKAARLISFSNSPAPLRLAIAILLDVAAAHASRGKAADAITFAERAHDLAEDNGLLPELRRACAIYGALSSEMGLPSRGLEYAIKAAEIGRQIDDPMAIAAAWSNMTAALLSMGLYRETIAVALRTLRRFKDDAHCAVIVASARTNLASAALALSHFALASDSARDSVAVLGVPRDAIGILNRVIAESVWMKAAIGLDQRSVVEERIVFLRGMSDAFKSPRLQLNHLLAEAAYQSYAGDLTIAVAKLLELLKHTKNMPNLYRDNLALLVKAYEKAGDHGGALIYLGELVEFLREKQVVAVRASLAAIEARHATPLPGKDDVKEVIDAIQRSRPGPPTATTSQQRAGATQVEVPEQEYRDAFERLAVSAEMKEDAGGRHAYRMGRLSGLLAEKLGYNAKFADEVEKGARLHDIGKLGIPDGLLLKSGQLSPSEWAVMKRHTLIGAQIIRQCSHSAFRVAEQIALCHHEKWDGTGYPNALRGEHIPVPARIVMLADVYDALTHARPYKHAWKHDDVAAFIRDNAGAQFDPTFATAFLEMVEDLRRKHGAGFEEFLAEPSKHSSFIRARDKMQTMMGEMGSLDSGTFL
jgi:putative two-component system response regulator